MLEDIKGEPARHVGEELSEALFGARYAVVQNEATYL